jgi:hypothetical protein
MKKFFASILLATFCILTGHAGIAPVLMNPYTTNLVTAADAYARTAVASITNGLATTNYVNGAVLAGGATTNFVLTSISATNTANLIITTNLIVAATNGLVLTGASTNFVLTSISATNTANLVITTNLIVAATNQLASTNYVNAAVLSGGATTNFVLTSISATNAANLTITTNLVVAATNNFTTLVYTNPSAILYTSSLPALTNGFVTSAITNGLATTNYVTNYVNAATNGLVTSSITNGLATTNYVNAATNGLVTSAITNGLATTNFVIAATNGLVTSSITNGLATTNYVIAATNGLVTSAVTNGLATTNYANTITNNFTALVYTNPSAILYTSSLPALTNGFVTSTITNGLATTNYANSVTNNFTAIVYSNPATYRLIGNTNFPGIYVTNTATIMGDIGIRIAPYVVPTVVALNIQGRIANSSGTLDLNQDIGEGPITGNNVNIQAESGNNGGDVTITAGGSQWGNGSGGDVTIAGGAGGTDEYEGNPAGKVILIAPDNGHGVPGASVTISGGGSGGNIVTVGPIYGNGVGLTNIAATNVIGLGTAAYSNATAFYLNSNPSNYVTSSVTNGLATTNYVISSIVDKTNFPGIYVTNSIITTNITTAGTELVLSQTGDTYGATRARLQNRNGVNGLLIENAGLNLADNALKSSSGNIATLRLESRGGAGTDLRSTLNYSNEIQGFINTQPLFGIGTNNGTFLIPLLDASGSSASPRTNQLITAAYASTITNGLATTNYVISSLVSKTNFPGIYVTNSAYIGTTLRQGYSVTASGAYSFAQGDTATASGYASQAEGYVTIASGLYTHAEGLYSASSGTGAHAEGDSSTASGYAAHAEGSTMASGDFSHAEGTYDTTANGYASHAEGGSTTGAAADYAHAEGYLTTASGNYSHSEGYNTTASGKYSHAEGNGITASGWDSHAEGFSTTASGNHSHAEGYQTAARSTYSHAEGLNTIAYLTSHAEGVNTYAAATSHAEGSSSTASGAVSHAAGYNAFATNDYTWVWSDGTSFGSTTNNQFSVYATNGIRLLGGPIYGNGGGLTNIAGTNLTGLGTAAYSNSTAFAPSTVTNLTAAQLATITAAVTNNASPTFTGLSVGAQTALDVNGNGNVGGVGLTNGVLTGNGAGLTNVSATVSYSNITNAYGAFAPIIQTNLTVQGATATFDTNAQTTAGTVACYVTNATPHSFQVLVNYSGTIVVGTNLFKLNYNTTFPTPPNPTWVGANNFASAVNSYRNAFFSLTTTNFVFALTGNALASPNTSYIWNFQVVY